MSYERPVVLSIAGYDPSGGAGVLADVKTFEQFHCLGMAAVTAWTTQTEDAFYSLEPLDAVQIVAQVKPLLERYPISWIKIGLFPRAEELLVLLQWLKAQSENLRIVWDPVLAASTGYSFTSDLGQTLLQEILKHIYLVTPNLQEAKIMTGLPDEQQAAAWLAQYCRVLLKGGHSTTAPGVDYLYQNDLMIPILPDELEVWAKHGSGCILSAALVAALAKGCLLDEACRTAKQYIQQVLHSNTQLLAYHAP